MTDRIELLKAAVDRAEKAAKERLFDSLIEGLTFNASDQSQKKPNWLLRAYREAKWRLLTCWDILLHGQSELPYSDYW